MPIREEIEQLLRDPRIWQARSGAAPVRAAVATGWPPLDRVLGGGWPSGQLTELLADGCGAGETRLLLPALARLLRPAAPAAAASGGWGVLVAPPHVPYAPAWRSAGVDLARLLVVHARRDLDVLWAMEQALRSQTCAAAVGWSQAASYGALRRLQLAAEESGAWVVLFRPACERVRRSPASLRIELVRHPHDERLGLHVMRRRGGAAVTTSVDVGAPA
ncbi:MAG: translesion DNA synthesis-associated protein ImuA [Gammaproteobacteria bacterium]|nr:translesion DNA synthesis-associated protein ImuA [Gammaproteobacteria bacterium]